MNHSIEAADDRQALKLRSAVTALVTSDTWQVTSDHQLEEITIIINALWASKQFDLIFALLEKAGLSVTDLHEAAFDTEELQKHISSIPITVNEIGDVNALKLF